MEFSECCEPYSHLPTATRVLMIVTYRIVDAAVAQTDSHRRIAFVAAFAMSNYSSTIGRIAKPFNPMLVSYEPITMSSRLRLFIQSETFEYVRLDREYRYMSEQVSHHPPISACYAESPSWRYYGEVVCASFFQRIRL